ncbi:MAG TPA: DUF192 domain-containing protein [Candidatus Baltobacteraceae bacterium]|nr:DUF192 domain-containing protein [Candidatus Baltobacteraceae bacterium]
MTGELRDARTGRLLVGCLVRADTLITQTIGFLGRTRVDDDEAMWFDSCSGIHTLGMRVAIDVVFVDRDGVVLDVVSSVKPWRFWVGRSGAKSVLELATGNAERCGITPSMHLETRWHSPT